MAPLSAIHRAITYAQANPLRAAAGAVGVASLAAITAGCAGPDIDEADRPRDWLATVDPEGFSNDYPVWGDNDKTGAWRIAIDPQGVKDAIWIKGNTAADRGKFNAKVDYKRERDIQINGRLRDHVWRAQVDIRGESDVTLIAEERGRGGVAGRIDLPGQRDVNFTSQRDSDGSWRIDYAAPGWQDTVIKGTPPAPSTQQQLSLVAAVYRQNVYQERHEADEAKKRKADEAAAKADDK